MMTFVATPEAAELAYHMYHAQSWHDHTATRTSTRIDT